MYGTLVEATLFLMCISTSHICEYCPTQHDDTTRRVCQPGRGKKTVDANATHRLNNRFYHTRLDYS